MAISGAPKGGKIMSMGKSDPRPGVPAGEKGSSFNKFSTNPFKDGGANEIRTASDDYSPSKGPTLGNAPKAQKVTDTKPTTT